MISSSFPLVSVIIPTKGCSKTIERAISSVLNQDYPNVECINVDFKENDDSTYEVVKRLFFNNKNVVYVESKIANLAYQRNLGVKICKGEFIVFLDGDDSLDKKYITKMFNSYIKNKADIVCCSYKRIDESGKQLNEETNLSNGTFSKIQILKKLYTPSHTVLSVCTCKFAKKELYVSIPINEHILNEDEATTYKHFMACERITVVNEDLYNYFIYKTVTLSSSHLKKMEKQVDGLIEVYLNRIELFKSLDSKSLKFKAYYELLNQTLSYAYLFQKNHNLAARDRCIMIYRNNYKTGLLVAHPFKLIKLILKYQRVNK